MSDLKHYVIRGGIEGRERLKMLARVMRPSTVTLFDRLGLVPGMTCIDIGCGSGDVTFELARRVGASGRVIGTDIDETKLQLADEEATELSLENVEFRLGDIRELAFDPRVDVVYARFLLTHLSDAAAAVDRFYQLVKPNGLVIVEDIDFSGHFVHPQSDAFDRYHELYCATVKRRGGDPNIGPRLPLLLKNACFVNVDACTVQPMSLSGEVKLISPLTMENIADAAIAEGLTTTGEVSEIVDSLYEYAQNPDTFSGVPRVVQAWGRRPS